ncbi:MAG: transcriptional regulator Spx [Erysipelothrix sp.]|nr:transcriptional regulator Spx [Erysipelothrix sp.]
MIVLYTSPGCASCRKVKKFLKENDLEFIEKNIITLPLNEVELRHLIQRSENGTSDIISTRSKIIRESDIDIDSMSLNELIRFIQTNPTVLRRPIIVSNRNFQVGYDEEEIEMFLPRKIREVAAKGCEEDCENFPYCGHWRNEEEEIITESR